MDCENVEDGNRISIKDDEECKGSNAKFLTSADLDAAFDSIILAEDRLNQTGYEAGKSVAKRKEVLEGFFLGAEKGFEIGSEVGIYRGFAKAWIQLLESKDRVSVKENRSIKILKKILDLKVPLENPTKDDEDPWIQLREMRAKFRQCKVLLGYEETAQSEKNPKTIDW